MANRSLRRVLLIVPAAIVMAVIATVAAAWLWFDPNDYRTRIEAAVQRQTGRQLVLAGPLHLTLTPKLAIEAADISFANQPGGSRPQMATAQRATAEIAWLPLLQRRIVITRLILTGPDLLLERDANGHPNWQMSASAPNTPHHAPPLGSTSRSAAPAVEVQGLRLVDGTLAWHGTRTLVFRVAQLDLTEATPDQPIALTAAASLGGTGFTLAGQFGSLDRLRDSAANTKWPARLSLRAAGASVDIDGSFTRPRRLGGYDLAVNAAVPDLALLAPLMPGVTLPNLHDLQVTGHIAAGTPFPVVSELVLHAGAADLDANVPGVRLTAADVEIPGPDRPMHARLTGSYAGSPLLLEAAGGTPASLLPGGSDGPFPLDVSAVAAGAKLRLRGAVAHPRERSGLAVTVSVDIPDLAALAPLARRSLPALRDLSLAAAVSDVGGIERGIALRGVRLTLPQGDLAGDLAIGFGDVPSFKGDLKGKNLDLDSVRAAWPAADPGPAKGDPSPPPPPPSPESPAARQFVIPATGFDFQNLHRADLDLRLELGELVAGRTTYRSVAGHLVLDNGHLTVEPATAVLPAGAATGHLEIDASQDPARVALSLHSAGLALKPLLTELQVPNDADGTLQVEADLHGVGDSPHAVAAGVDGVLGLSMVGGSVANRLLAAAFGDLLRAAKLPAENGGNGHTDLRCFALRLDANHGVAAVRAFLIDISRLRVAGSGTIDLARETLALRLRPFVKIAGTGIVVPVHVGGTFRRPQAAVDPSGPPEAAAALAAGLAQKDSPVTGITSALAAGGERLLGEADTGNCGPALALARDGKPGPEPAPIKPERAAPVVEDLLKRLFK